MYIPLKVVPRDPTSRYATIQMLMTLIRAIVSFLLMTRSAMRMTMARQASPISGIAGTRLGIANCIRIPPICSFQYLHDGPCGNHRLTAAHIDAFQQMAHRGVHVTQKGIRVYAYPEYQYDHRQQGHDLPCIYVGQAADLR